MTLTVKTVADNNMFGLYFKFYEDDDWIKSIINEKEGKGLFRKSSTHKTNKRPSVSVWGDQQRCTIAMKRYA